jgi:hypothetical protein
VGLQARFCFFIPIILKWQPLINLLCKTQGLIYHSRRHNAYMKKNTVFIFFFLVVVSNKGNICIRTRQRATKKRWQMISSEKDRRARTSVINLLITTRFLLCFAWDQIGEIKQKRVKRWGLYRAMC